MSSGPRVSILMATLNCVEYIERTIATVTDQSFEDWELIVMDACSTDGTVEAIQGLAHPNIRLHVEPDEGVSHAWDKAMRLARGDYLLLLCGQDGYHDPDWLKTCVDTMDGDGEVSLVWGVPAHLLGEGGELVPGGWWSVYVKDQELLAAHQKQGWLQQWLSTGCTFPDGNMCIRREVYVSCVPAYRPGSRVMDMLHQFFYNFVSRGYMPWGVGRIVSFSRTHEGQLSAVLAHQMRLSVHDYTRRVRRHRARLLADELEHVFRDGAGQTVSVLPPLSGRVTMEHLLIRDQDGNLVDGTELFLAAFPAD